MLQVRQRKKGRFEGGFEGIVNAAVLLGRNVWRGVDQNATFKMSHPRGFLDVPGLPHPPGEEFLFPNPILWPLPFVNL